MLPLTGFLICLYLWWNLSQLAKIVGLIWLSTGFLYGAWKTNGSAARSNSPYPMRKQ